jgi:hypothetical protein
VIVAHYIVNHVEPDYEIAYLGLMVMVVMALGVFISDILWNKVHTRLQGDGSCSLNLS